jgi:hypothetical protein
MEPVASSSLAFVQALENVWPLESDFEVAYQRGRHI